MGEVAKSTSAMSTENWSPMTFTTIFSYLC